MLYILYNKEVSLRRGWADPSGCLSDIHALFFYHHRGWGNVPKGETTFPSFPCRLGQPVTWKRKLLDGALWKKSTPVLCPFVFAARWPGGNLVLRMMEQKDGRSLDPWWLWNSHTSPELLPSRHFYVWGKKSLSWLKQFYLGFLLNAAASKFDQGLEGFLISIKGAFEPKELAWTKAQKCESACF